MRYPTSYLKSKGLGKFYALVTDGRFSGGSSGLCIGHISPEAAEGGAIALVEEGDTIQIDIPKRILRVKLTASELAARRKAMKARLQPYAAWTTSASCGAVRDVSRIQK